MVLLVLQVAASFAGHLIRREGVRTRETLDLLVVHRLDQLVWPFTDGRSRTLQLAFVAVVVLAAVITGLLTFLSARLLVAGTPAPAVLLLTWMAVVLATTTAQVPWAIVYADQIGGGRAPAYWADVLERAPWWGVLLGWVPALAATIAYAMTNRGRPVTAPHQPAWQPATREERP
ncbi:hypothetical protein VV01_05870 [Luteipulveratus halotolerans]|uniref:Uncharacterized protein n=1 Tax=Luteipulveratus halotolerans TaxID=1631356 RepID=A0A0L6CGQ1_9MICO|nr:hypothetical protein VV01_05870 [Luteipulveratus halotolerans]